MPVLIERGLLRGSLPVVFTLTPLEEQAMKKKVLLTLSMIATLLLVAGAAQAQVVVVSGANPPLVNGANLLAAIAGIPFPGPANPWVVRLEPGIYDLGGQQIVMRDFVNLEGAGRSITTIESDVSLAASPATVEVPAAVTAEIGNLTIRNLSARDGVGINIDSSNFLLNEATLDVTTGGNGTGARISNVTPRLNEVFVRVFASGSGFGFEVSQGGPVIVQCVAVVVSAEKTFGALLSRSSAVLEGVVLVAAAGIRNTGIYIEGRGTPKITNTRATANAASSESFGLWTVNSAAPDVKESTFTAFNDSLAVALLTQSASSIKATESTFVARPSTLDHLNVFGVRADGGNAFVNQSNIDSSSFAVQALGTGTARFGASQLIGTAAGPLGSLTCRFTYNNLYAARAVNCV